MYISKSKLQEVETALAEDRIKNLDAAIIPANIYPNVPVSLVWDNNDFREETPSGKNTTHCTTGIVIQPVVASCEPPKRETNCLPTHQRSIQKLLEQTMIEYTYGNRRCRHQRIQGAAELLQNRNLIILGMAHSKDFAWFLLRLGNDLSTSQEGRIQKVPGWCGFNAAIRRNEATELVTYQ